MITRGKSAVTYFQLGSQDGNEGQASFSWSLLRERQRLLPLKKQAAAGHTLKMPFHQYTNFSTPYAQRTRFKTDLKNELREQYTSPCLRASFFPLPHLYIIYQMYMGEYSEMGRA
jgi:hypothetical protein